MMPRVKHPDQIRAAKRPHELFVLNLIFFHLLALPIGLAFELGYWGMVVPPLSTSLLLLYFRSQLAIHEGQGERWVADHWRQAIQRFRWLYIGYLVVAILIGMVLLFVEADSIAFVALTRVALMPAIILVLVTFVMSTAAIGRAGSGEA